MATPTPVAATPEAAAVSQAIAVENSVTLATGKDREVPRRMHVLAASVAGLQSVVSALHKRLEPIVSPTVATNAAKPAAQNSTALGTALQNTSDSIDDEVAILNALLDGLEI